MEIKLSPELRAKVERGMAEGGYESADAYVVDAIEAMQEQEKWLQGERAKLDEALAEAHRGEVFTEEEVREYMRKRKSEFLRQQSAA